MHKGMVGEGWIEGARLACVGSDRLHANAKNIALLDQEVGAGLVEAGRMCAIGAYIEKLFAALALAPAGLQQDPCSGRYATMLALPLLNTIDAQQEILGLLYLGGCVDNTAGADKFARRNRIGGIVGQILAGHPVNWRVEVRPRVLAHIDNIPIPAGAALIVTRNLGQGDAGRRCENRWQVDHWRLWPQ